MNNKIEEYKKLLIRDVYLLGYENIRYSIFEDEEKNMEEYQVRIECVDANYMVYVVMNYTNDIKKYESDNIFTAMRFFINRIQSLLRYNRHRVLDGNEPEYECELWGDEWLKDYKKRSRLL